jgi:hypothetical protein
MPLVEQRSTRCGQRWPVRRRDHLLVLTVSEPDDYADLAHELGDRRSLAACIVSFVVTGIMRCTPEGATDQGSLLLSAFDPALEEVDLCSGPGAIARHGAVAEACEDGVGVSADVVEGPQVEAGLHRLLVTLAEHGLDVGFKAGRAVDVVGHSVLLTSWE